MQEQQLIQHQSGLLPQDTASTLDLKSLKTTKPQPSRAVISVQQNQDQTVSLRSFKQVFLVALLTFFMTFMILSRRNNSNLSVKGSFM